MSLKSKLAGIAFITSVILAPLTHVVKHNEGYSETAYRDGAGVWTICYGETNGVRRGQIATREQCNAQLSRSIAEHAKALDGLPAGLPDVVVLGAMDAAYNIGVYGYSSSTSKRHLANKDYAAAGKAILKFKYITLPNGQKFDCSTPGNTICYGLWKRRLWQSKAIGNEFPSVEAALAALPR